MWCPDDTGRDSWGWVGPPAWERACFNSPEWGGGSSPVKTEPLQIVLLLLLLLVLVVEEEEEERLIGPSGCWFPPKFPSGELKLNSFISKATDQMSRARVVLDLFSNLKWVRSSVTFGEPLGYAITLRGPFMVSRRLAMGRATWRRVFRGLASEQEQRVNGHTRCVTISCSFSPIELPLSWSTWYAVRSKNRQVVTWRLLECRSGLSWSPHTLTCCTHIFMRAHTRMAQAQVVSKRCLLHVYHTSPSCLLYLMFHPSLLFLYIHFDIPFQSTILPYFPVLKAQDMRHSTLASRSLATWPSQMHSTGYEPNEFDKTTSVDGDTMLIDDPDLNEISDFSKNTHEIDGLFGILTVFESSVSLVSHDDFALQIESKESMHRETDC